MFTVSATFVQIPGYGNVLLDCGEGTYGQLSRHFGPRTKDALRDLRCIFISHIHADHHMGLSRLLAMRRKVSRRSQYFCRVLVDQKQSSSNLVRLVRFTSSPPLQYTSIYESIRNSKTLALEN